MTSFIPSIAVSRPSNLTTTTYIPRLPVVFRLCRPHRASLSPHPSRISLSLNGAPQTPPPSPLLTRLLSGFSPTPELFAILTVYFIQGALSLSRLALSYFLKDTLHLSPAQVAAITGIAMFPWLIKPVYGFLSDSLPLFGSRRRSYLLLSSAVGILSWASLASIVDTSTAAIAASTAASFSVALSDVVVDSLVVERVRGLPDNRSAALQSLCWGSSAVGGLLSAYFSGSLLEIVGVREVFAVTAILPLIAGLMAAFVAEETSHLSDAAQFWNVIKQRSRKLWEALSNKAVYLPVAFIFAWQATPSPDSALFFFQTNQLQFGPEFLGRVRLVSSAAALFGLYIYRTFCANVSLKKFFFWCTLISVPLSLTQVVLVTRLNVQLGISDKLFALADSAVLTALGQVAFMPTLVLAARLCPVGVEGTLFAALMSIYNASGAVSTELGAVMTHALGITENEFGGLGWLVTICSLSYLIPLPLLGLLDGIDDQTESQDVDSQVQAAPEVEPKIGKVDKSRIEGVPGINSSRKE